MMGPSKWQPYNLSTPLDPEIIQDSGCIKYCSYKPLNIQPKSVTFLAARALEFDFKIKKNLYSFLFEPTPLLHFSIDLLSITNHLVPYAKSTICHLPATIIIFIVDIYSGEDPGFEVRGGGT